MKFDVTGATTACCICGRAFSVRMQVNVLPTTLIPPSASPKIQLPIQSKSCVQVSPTTLATLLILYFKLKDLKKCVMGEIKTVVKNKDSQVRKRRVFLGLKGIYT